MRTPAEIQRAHDLFGLVSLASDVFGHEPGENMLLTCVAPDVLCWVLEHDHNQRFADDLERIERALKPLLGTLVNRKSAK
jgi:hypothetical protein